jgi:hypothetical protein
MNVCAHIPSRPMCFLAVIVLLTTTVSTQTLQAQPGQTQSDMDRLQSQLASLQNQIAMMQQDENSGDTDRVRSVGSQRSKRALEAVVDDSLEIRLYDLSDIFAVSPQYPALMPTDISNSTAMFQNRPGQMMMSGGQGGGGGGFGGGGMNAGGGGVFRVPPTQPRIQPANPPVGPQGGAGGSGLQSATISLDQLVEAIQNAVSPDQWEENGGEATIQFLSNTLLITATKNMHKQTNDLINLFREHFGKRRTISVQTFWIRAGEAEATELLDAESSETLGAGVVKPETWKAFLASAKSDKRVAYSAALTCHNNQTVHALSGQQRQLTVDAIPFETTTASMWFENADQVEPFGDRDENDEDMNLFNRTRKVVGFKPVRQSFLDGAAIQVTPLATRGGNFVILDLHAKVNELITPEADTKPPSIFVKFGENDTAEVELDHANYVSYRLSTTVRCPKEQVVLAGGMTYDPNAEADVPNLYLFVKTSVHTITEDKSDWSKDANQPKK